MKHIIETEQQKRNQKVNLENFLLSLIRLILKRYDLVLCDS